MTETTALTKYDSARYALQIAASVDEVKDIRDKAQAMAAYARQANDTAMIEWATEIKVRAERRAGQMLAEMPKAQAGRPSKNPSHDGSDLPKTLDEMGITFNESSRWQKLAKVSDEKFEAAVTAAKEIAGEVTTAYLLRVEKQGEVHVSHNSGENEWYTPGHFIEAARNTMGSIDTDPASSKIANETVKAGKYFDANSNGLVQKWSGNVWMNPPYAQPLISEFASAVARKYTAKEISQACVLVNNGTETSWFQTLLDVASAVCFVKTRIKFVDMNGLPSGAPLQGQAVIYIGPRCAEFAEAFSPLGTVLYA